MTIGKTKPTVDTSTLTPLHPSMSVFRAIDPDDVARWIESEGRWDLAPSAMTTDELTPGPRAGYGYSLFVPSLLASRTAATSGKELHFLQRHAQAHPCKATWREGLVTKVQIGDLLKLGFGAGESPGDGACDETRQGHASLWKDPAWKKAVVKKARAAALKLMGESWIFEDQAREDARMAAKASVPPVSPGSGRPSTP